MSSFLAKVLKHTSRDDRAPRQRTQSEEEARLHLRRLSSRAYE
ncbi:hypothetical protein [Wenxinia marina]|uniref:Uncharacterized protein n=1 Tax=Wenxinia marina DSM 24838 TaxID=1123501 RepID=A0A0D0Q9I5_9RHOB|nr:hypothetical protein [Wenxinia marina]KIQ71089.1 hypothetical protein Wenmar_00467 [Wenxinia marina DSM 24838]GGL54931.1 hypothetical protein GCM10011392_06670 [Wenxinia marina]